MLPRSKVCYLNAICTKKTEYNIEGGECDLCLYCECLYLFKGIDSKSVAVAEWLR